MNSQSNGSSIKGLFQAAQAEQGLSQATLTAINIGDIGADITAALGVSVDDIMSSEVVILTLLADDSSSINDIREDPNDRNSKVVGPELIRMGHNLLVDALTASNQNQNILASASLLNRGLVYPYSMINKAPRFDDKNYRAGGGTPLYDKSIVTLGTVIAKNQEFLTNGVTSRTITAIITDGADYGSLKGAKDVAKIVSDVLANETNIVAAVGIDDGRTNFRQVFGEMGIRDEWILTPKNSPSEIRKALNTLSQSAVRISQARAGSASFSQAAMGGFGTP